MTSAALTLPEPWEAFLAASNLPGAHVLPLASDWAARRYYRVHHNGRSYVLMVCQDETTRTQMPAFMEIAALLAKGGFAVPAVLNADEAVGLMLLEDFGDLSFADAMAGQNATPDQLYDLAGDVLSRFRTIGDVARSMLPLFADTAVAKGHRRVIDWYVPAFLKGEAPDGMRAAYLAAMRKIEASLPPIPQGFVHIDFHVENLMWLEEREGLSRCGILDFQGAAWGPCIYDLTNLLRDNRRLVDPAIQDRVLASYLSGFPKDQHEALLGWYRLYAVQFHFRVIGQVLKLALNNNRAGLLGFIPRLSSYLQDELSNPMFREVAGLFREAGIDWSHPAEADLDKLPTWIAADAY